MGTLINTTFFRLVQSTSVRHMATLFSGAVLAQIIVISITPFLTRLYSPEAFGVLALFMSIISVAAAVINGRFELAIPIPKSDREAMHLCGLGLLITIGLSLLSFFTLKIGISHWMGGWVDHTYIWIYLLPLSLGLSGINQIHTYWANRKQAFKLITVSQFCQVVMSSVGYLVGSVIYSGPAGLVGGFILGQICRMISLCTPIWQTNQNLIKEIQWDRLKAVFVQYIEYPIFTSWTSLLNSISTHAPIFVMTKLFDASVVGFFSMTNRILRSPARLISGSVAPVYFQKIAEKEGDKTEIYRIFMKTGVHLAILAIVPLIIVMSFGPDIFEFLLGEKWRSAGEYAQIIAPAIAIRFIVSPLSTVFAATNTIKTSALWKSIYFVTTIGIMGTALLLPIKLFLTVFCIHEVVLYTLHFGLMVRVSKPE